MDTIVLCMLKSQLMYIFTCVYSSHSYVPLLEAVEFTEGSFLEAGHVSSRYSFVSLIGTTICIIVIDKQTRIAYALSIAKNAKITKTHLCEIRVPEK